MMATASLLRTLAAVALVAAVVQANVPNGFVNEKLMDVQQAMSMAFLPDGRLLVARRVGQVFICDDSSLPMQKQQYAYVTNVEDGGEKGLMSIAVHPEDFEDFGYVYMYYSKGGAFRISRFTHKENQGDLTSRLDMASEKILWKDPSGYGGPFHYGGDISFGPDGCIYMTNGDTTSPWTSEDMFHSGGKILRINRDGSIPSDNMGVLADGWGGQLDHIWARGVRNGYSSRWDLETNRYFFAEVGGNNQQVAVEDLHLGVAGANYGWPNCEGLCDNPDFKSTCDCSKHESPIFWYDHKDSSKPTGANAAIIGGFVYHGKQFPSKYDGVYFYGDYSRDHIKYLTFDKNNNKKVTGSYMFEDYSGPIIKFEPSADGNYFIFSTLYELRRVRFINGPNLPPNIVKAEADVMSGPPPLKVSFSAQAVDVDGDTLSYLWHFGDGTTKLGKNPTKTYGTLGPVNAYLEVSDGSETVFSDDINIMVGSPPEVKITKPMVGQEFIAGDVIDFSGWGEARPSGQKLGSSSLKWEILVVHDDHVHPHDAHTGPDGSLNVPTTGHPFSSKTGYRFILTATDSMGLTATTYVDVFPTKTNVNLVSNLGQGTVFIDQVPNNLPYVLDSVEKFQHIVTAKASMCIQGMTYVFDKWSDNGAVSHQIVVGFEESTLTATYVSGNKQCTTSEEDDTCASRCGEYAPEKSCQCDAGCASHGDCCSDIGVCSGEPETTLPPATTTEQPLKDSCAARCGEYKSSETCQCDAGCESHGDCCSDYKAKCTNDPVTTTQSPTTTAAAASTTNSPTDAPTTAKATDSPKDGSCAARCNSYNAGMTCQCDPNCADYGDCCLDMGDVCGTGPTSAPSTSGSPTTTEAAVTSTILTTTNSPAAAGSCAGRCDEYVAEESCQCDSGCEAHGDCCADLEAKCSSEEPGTMAPGEGGSDDLSCKDRCGNYNPSSKCNCDKDCAPYNDCCEDIADVCPV